MYRSSPGIPIKKAIIIGGPTASGKTSLAIDIAKYFSTDIISCDSRQCYREMNIGVAKPSVEELQSVPHHFINSHSVTEEVNAAFFESYALSIAKNIFERSDHLVMVGGTGLYIKAFAEGIDHIPAIPAEIRKQVMDQYDQHGMQWLQHEVKMQDHLYFSSGEIFNPQRLMRALEVKLATGRSIREYQKQFPLKRDFIVEKFAIAIDRGELIRRIDLRVENMIEAGLVDEVRSLLPYKDLPAMKTVGYQEIFDHLDGRLTLDQAIERIKINTRQYAKRQMTWFRKQQFTWIAPGDASTIIEACNPSKNIV